MALEAGRLGVVYKYENVWGVASLFLWLDPIGTEPMFTSAAPAFNDKQYALDYEHCLRLTGI